MRLHGAGAEWSDALLLVALAAASPGGSSTAVERGMRTGLTMSAGLTDMVGDGPQTGRPTTGAVAAAACAAVAGGADATELGPLLDVAASLMVVRPAQDGTPLQSALSSGHCLAAGWLAPRLLGAGIVGMAGALRDTVSTVTGSPAGELRAAPDPGTVEAPVRAAADLLAALG